VADKSAKDVLQDILDETARRRDIWHKLEKAIADAVQAVMVHAKKLGIDSEWLTQGSAVTVDYEKGRDRTILVFDSAGALELPHKDKAYGRHPNFTDNDVSAIKKMAIEELMSRLYSYQQEKGKR